MQRVSETLRRILSVPWLPAILSLAGFVIYVLQAIEIAHTKTSFLDEGMYVYKGWLFATGKYVPFEEYGVWTNHAILSFLIPGYVQKWFGPGLDVARYFMIFLGVLTLSGLWVFARRWGGQWWAAGAVWMMALNPAEIKIHTLALSQGLIAVMMAWMLVFTVGVKRPLWQLMLGGALAGLMIHTRENLVFVLPLLFLYILWQYGWKTGFLVLAAGLLVFAIGVLRYWPDAWNLVASRAPGPLRLVVEKPPSTPPSEPSAAPPSTPTYGERIIDAELEAGTPYRKFLYVWLTIRLHFVALVSAIAVWLLWPWPKRFQLSERMRAAVFLSVLLLVLMAAHMQASVFSNICVSCILLYVGYFDFIGFLLLVVAYRFLVRDLGAVRRILVFAFGIVAILSIGLTAYEDVSTAFAKSMIERLDRVYLWNALLNLTGLPHLVLFRGLFVLSISVLVVLAFAAGLLWTRRWYADRNTWRRRAGLLGLNALLIVGLLLSPTKALGKGNDFFACDGSDVLASYERAGEHLRSLIPPGSQVYWDGRINAIFLYLPDVNIYPAQLNHQHSYFVGGDADALARMGFWNDELAKQWLAEADYVLIEAGEQQDWVMQIVESDRYIKLKQAPKAERCRWQSSILVFKRVDSSD